MKYDLAIFDLDGTILDTLDDLTDSVNVALRKNALPARTRHEIRGFVGNGMRLLVTRSVYGCDAPAMPNTALLERVHADFTAHYQAHCKDKTKPYPHIIDVLCTLRAAGVKTAVISNKADYGVQLLIGEYFPGLFTLAAGERDGIAKKPAPDAIFAVARTLGISMDRTVYIGDSEVDVQTAQNAGIPCLSVAWGFKTTAFLRAHGATTIISGPQELVGHIV